MIFLVGDVNFYNINSGNKDDFVDGAWNGENHFITLLFDVSNPNCYLGHNRMQIRSVVTRSNIPVSVVILLPGNLPNQTFAVFDQILADFGANLEFKLGLNYLPNKVSFKKYREKFDSDSDSEFKKLLKVRQQIADYYIKNCVQYLEPYSIFYHWK